MPTRAEAWDVAKALVVRDGATYAEASSASGLPVSTIQKRAADEGWQADRETSVSYAATIKALKQGLLAKAMLALDAGEDATQLVFAWKTAEATFPEHRYSPTKLSPGAKLAVAADLLDILVKYLSEHDTVALAKVQPHILEIGKRFEAFCNG